MDSRKSALLCFCFCISLFGPGADALPQRTGGEPPDVYIPPYDKVDGTTIMKDKASLQLKEYKESMSNKKPGTIVTGFGAPIADKLHTLTVGPRGPALLQDVAFLDEMAHFDRERVPERVVHAKGAGAFGYFEVTDDITKYTKAVVFSQVGKRTPLAVRFSAVTGENGAPDTLRDIKGFAIKFYTEDGNWDLVCNHSPVFFIRDPFLFPTMVHAIKRNPVTNLKDFNMFWDFLSSRPESVHQTLFMFGDRGIPAGYRHMHGFGANTFKLVNAEGTPVYVKFHLLTDQGIQNFVNDDAGRCAAHDPDFATRDLYNAIAEGDYPSWTFYIQVMTFDQAEKSPFNPFDVTKVWPHGDFPLIRVGKLKLNKNPINYFAQVEQIAFSPANMIPGVEASPDRILQGRLFSYADTQRHRIGANYFQIPVNEPMNAANRGEHYQRAGPMTVTMDHDGAPNYYPNSFSGPEESKNSSHRETPFPVSGDVNRFEDPDQDFFSQPKIFWERVLTPEARQRLADNMAGHLMNAEDFLQERALGNFAKVHEDLARMVKESIQKQRDYAAA